MNKLLRLNIKKLHKLVKHTSRTFDLFISHTCTDQPCCEKACNPYTECSISALSITLVEIKSHAVKEITDCCIVTIYTPRRLFPHCHHSTLDSRSAKHIHSHMQKVMGDVQMQPVRPLTTHPLKYQTLSNHKSKSTAHGMSQTRQPSRETCWFLNIKECQCHELGKYTQHVFGWCVWLICLLSGGTLSLCGQPDRLRWWGYRPVTWPVPSQPGVGHRLSFLSAREASVGRKAHGGDGTLPSRMNVPQQPLTVQNPQVRRA